MKYKYTATTKEGKTVNGEMVARTTDEVSSALQSDGFLILNIEEIQEKKEGKGKSSGLFQKKVPLKDKIILFTNLAAMLKAGLPVVDAIEILAEGQKSAKLQEILQVAIYDVQGGMTFHSTLSKFPDVFTPMDLSMFEVGEIGGMLEENIKTLSIQLKKQSDLQSKVRGAMMYPIVISVALVGIMIVLMAFVIPKVSSFFEEADLQLPLMTRVLITISDLIVNNGILVGILLVLSIIGFRTAYKKSKNFKRMIDGGILRIPFVGDVIAKLSISRFTRTLGSLLKSGVSIVKSLDIAKNGFTNIVYYEAIENVADDVESGAELSAALDKYPKLFYPMVVRMVRVGSQTGTVDESLFNISDFYDEEVTSVLENISTIIEPVMLLGMGVAIAIIAMSVISPIYQLVGGVSQSA